MCSLDFIFCLLPGHHCFTALTCQTVRHGFPYQPSSLAFDPVQKILAIGTQTGALRLYPFLCSKKQITKKIVLVYIEVLELL